MVKFKCVIRALWQLLVKRHWLYFMSWEFGILNSWQLTNDFKFLRGKRSWEPDAANIKCWGEKKSLKAVILYLVSFNASFARPTECKIFFLNMTQQVLLCISFQQFNYSCHLTANLWNIYTFFFLIIFRWPLWKSLPDWLPRTCRSLDGGWNKGNQRRNNVSW